MYFGELLKPRRRSKNKHLEERQAGNDMESALVESDCKSATKENAVLTTQPGTHLHEVCVVGVGFLRLCA